jgi:hypothetical protein
LLGVNIDQGVGDNRELAVARRQVEMMHQITARVGVRKNAGPGIDRQLKNETALVAFTSGVHANFHHALPDELAVAKAREMSNRVEHRTLSF